MSEAQAPPARPQPLRPEPARDAVPRPGAFGVSIALHGALLVAATVLFVAAPAERPTAAVSVVLRPVADTLEEVAPVPQLDINVPPRVDEALLPDDPEPALEPLELEPASSPVIELRSTHAAFGADVRIRPRRVAQAPAAPAPAMSYPASRAVAAQIVARVPDVVRPPRPHADNHAPLYPRRAERRGWVGSVRLRIDIDAVGSVMAVEIDKSSGFSVLDEAARNAALAWGYEPARRGQSAVTFTLYRTVRFTR